MSRSRAWIAVALAVGTVPAVCIGAEIDPVPLIGFDAPEPARGRMTLGFQTVHTKGSLDDSGDATPFLRNLETDTRSLALAVDYRMSDRWSLQASLPFIRKRAVNAPPAHNPARLVVPRTDDSDFIDDGRYHSTWQDWQLGLSYHTMIAGFHVRPHVTVVYPSRDYTFFAAAAVGQRLKRLRVGVDASRRLGRTNFHYAAGYSYEFVEEILGVNIDKQHFRLSGRYDFSPRLSADVFAVGRRARGLDASIFPAEARRGSELWYQHDRLLRQNYTLAGFGATWRFNDDWALSAATSRMASGDSIYDLKYAYDLSLTRAF